MMSSRYELMTLVIGGIVLCSSWKGSGWAADVIPTTIPADSRPTTQPPVSLQTKIVRTVELAQQAIRSRRPASTPAKNTLRQEEQKAPPDPVAALASELIGKSGLVAFRISDVMSNDGRHFPLGAPPAAMEMRDTLPYLIVAEVDNPTAIQLTPSERRQIQQANQKGLKRLSDYLHKMVDERRPLHRLFIGTDDPAVRDWGKGERRSIRGTVIAVRLDRVVGGYIRANVVVRHDHAPTTAPAQ